MSIESILKMATERFKSCDAKFDPKGLEKGILASIERKSKLNTILGLDESNDFTLTIPLIASERDVRSAYRNTNYLIERLLYFLHVSQPEYSITENYVQGKSGKTKLTRHLSKYEEFIKSSEFFKQSLTELSNDGARATKTFQDFVCRLGELKDTGGNELFITTSIAEMWGVNWNSAYRSCLRHKKETDTSYFAGTSAYGMDDFTLLVGVRRKSDKYKLGRSWLHVWPDGVDSKGKDHKTPFMVQVKSYGEFDTNMRKLVRESIQKKINQYLSDPANDWVTGASENLNEEKYHGYIDNYDLQISYKKRAKVSRPTSISASFAQYVPCIHCGDIVKTVTEGGSLCDKCQDEYYCRCQDCGGIIHRQGDAHPVNGENLCRGCYNARFFTCSCCNETFDKSEAVNAVIEGRTVTICKGCMDDTFNICSICGNAHKVDKMNESVEGRIICESCSEGYCDDCGKFFEPESESYDTDDGCAYCTNCQAAHMPEAA